MCLTSSFVSCRCCISPKHLRTAPTHQPHEVRLATAVGFPTMRCSVTKLVSMESGDTDFLAPPLEHLPDAISTQWAAVLLTQPESRQVRPLVMISKPEVPTKRLSGLEAEGDDPDPGTLADHGDVPFIQRHVRRRESGDLASPAPGVHEHPDDRRISPINQIPAVAGSK